MSQIYSLVFQGGGLLDGKAIVLNTNPQRRSVAIPAGHRLCVSYKGAWYVGQTVIINPVAQHVLDLVPSDPRKSRPEDSWWHIGENEIVDAIRLASGEVLLTRGIKKPDWLVEKEKAEAELAAKSEELNPFVEEPQQ